MAIDLNNIDLDAIGSWPWTVKIIIIAVLCVLILAGGFWYFNMPQLDLLEKAQNLEVTLRQDFESKQAAAAVLKQYEIQMEEIQRTFGALLKTLPSKTEVPGLLDDISEALNESGLQATVFKPLEEVDKGFYAELPIELVVAGDYHQLAEFVSKVAALDRIVTVHNFTIEPAKANIQASSKNTEDSGDRTQLLTMQVTAKTYRYLEKGSETDMGKGHVGKGGASGKHGAKPAAGKGKGPTPSAAGHKGKH